MRQTLRKILVTIGALTVFFWAVMIATWIVGAMVREPLPGHAVLEVDLTGDVAEEAADGPLYELAVGHTLTMRDVVEGLEQAAQDKHVEAVVARIGGGSLGFAQVQELRSAVAKFRESGKPAIAFGESYDTRGYYLATAFEQVWMQPSGDVALIGLLSTAMFTKNLLAKIGIEPRLDHRAEYKSAMNTFTEERFTAAHRESVDAILGSIYDQLVLDIAAARKVEAGKVRALVDGAPYFGEEAAKAGLIDTLGYAHAVHEALEKRVGRDLETLPLRRYRARESGPHDHGDVVALIYASGTIVSGNGDGTPLWGETQVGSDSMRRALRAAIEDDDVKAIVLRIDSPGGSYVASDAIWHETTRAKEAHKPLIASMGNVAGSGGYFIALGAEHIVAEPATITGSIGVVGGKMLVRGLTQKLGITFDSVQRGRHADFESGVHDFDAAEWQRLTDSLDRVYADFKGKVAAARKLTAAQVEAAAKGRIWSGAQAKELGLVDALGGMTEALALAKEAAGIDKDAGIELRVYPPPKNPLQMLLDRDTDALTRNPLGESLARELEALRPLVTMLGLRPPLGMLEMPLVPVVR
ncbi:MAG: signal peptide peptidase SppA [Myxococcota bacterium]